MIKSSLLFGLLISSLLCAFAQESPQLKTRPSAPSDHKDFYANRLSGTVKLTVDKKIEMKKLKVGDEIQAKLQEDIKVEQELIVPKKSTFVGHVTEIMSRQSGSPLNRLALVFDHAVTKGGADLPIYGTIIGVFAPVGDSISGADALQETRLRHMRTEGLMGQASGETIQTFNELYQTSLNGQPTLAAQQWNCRQALGGLWCVPPGHTLVHPPTPVTGIPDVFLEAETTPQGPLGVLLSAKQNITINGGVDLFVRLVPRPN